MPIIRRFNVYAAALLLPLCGLAGCASTPQQARSPWVHNGPVAPDALRLQKIADALLLYFRRFKHLPRTLSDPALQPNGRPLKLVDPATGRPYVYAPRKLPDNPVPVWLLVYDAAPVHGRRWAILAQPPAGGRPVSMWVDQMTEAAFRQFNPAAKGSAAP